MVLQVSDVKHFTAEDNKKNIKMRYSISFSYIRINLSDGGAFVIAMVTEKVDK